MNQEASKNEVASGFRKKKSKILYQITILMLIVFVASGLTSFFIFRGSQNRLAQESIDKLIDTEAMSFASRFSLALEEIFIPILAEAKDKISFEETMSAFQEKRITEAQVYVVDELIRLVDGGMLGVDALIAFSMPATLVPEPTVTGANDASLIYNWEVPGYVIDALDNEEPYIYLAEGMPELGLDGEQLVLIEKVKGPGHGIEYGVLAVRDMREDVGEIMSFYDEEKSNATLMMAIVIAVSAVMLILITFFILSYLIRKQITDPIDELSAAAEQVMDGDLDVEIAVREGEEFEGLKHVFKEMVDSIKRMIERSMEG